jgi:CMP-N-acetylneuraminic acid synthetase
MILGIIPARGGSKGIPRKNIRPCCGKPLIAWTIESAKRARFLDRFVVSTEDDEIASVAEQYGAEVIPRPIELATDEATTLSVLQHVLSVIDADVVVLLQCTSPIRDDEIIDRCIRTFSETGADSVATGFICTFYEWGSYREERRQDLDGFFYDDGNVYVLSADNIRRGDLFGERKVRMLTSREQNIEIDDEFDFWIAEQVLRYKTGLGGR